MNTFDRSIRFTGALLVAFVAVMTLPMLLLPAMAYAQDAAVVVDQELVVRWLLEQRWLALSALVVGGIVRAAKAGWWPERLKVEPRNRELFVMALGVVSGVLEAMVAGTPAKEAIARGLASGVVAILGHRIVIDWLRAGRELGEPKKA